MRIKVSISKAYDQSGTFIAEREELKDINLGPNLKPVAAWRRTGLETGLTLEQAQAAVLLWLGR